MTPTPHPTNGEDLLQLAGLLALVAAAHLALRWALTRWRDAVREYRAEELALSRVEVRREPAPSQRGSCASPQRAASAEQARP